MSKKQRAEADKNLDAALKGVDVCFEALLKKKKKEETKPNDSALLNVKKRKKTMTMLKALKEQSLEDSTMSGLRLLEGGAGA